MPNITTLVVQIKKSLASITTVDGVEIIDWVPALKAMATEIKALNLYVGKLGINPATKKDYFPRPISCNPDAMVWVEEHEEDVAEAIVQVSTGWMAESIDAVTGAVTPSYETFREEIIPAHKITVSAGYQGNPAGFVGDAHGWPSAEGFFTVQLHNYSYLKPGSLPAAPTTFEFVHGVPEGTATYI